MAQNSNLLSTYQAAAISQGAAHNSNVAAEAQEAEISQGVSLEANNSAVIAALIPHW